LVERKNHKGASSGPNARLLNLHYPETSDANLNRWWSNLTRCCGYIV